MQVPNHFTSQAYTSPNLLPWVVTVHSGSPTLFHCLPP